MIEKEALGINDYEFIYYELNSNQDALLELVKTTKFFTENFSCYLRDNYPNYYSQHMKIKFINWGHMEVVYVLDNGHKKYTLLMGQPNLEFGKIQEEYNNLRILGENNENIVIPLLYYGNPNSHREVYMTPYFYQARCISYLDDKLGIYVPEPNYHFEEFNENDKNIVEEAITAKIISLYNLNTHIGLDAFKVSSGDFILKKGFEYSRNNAGEIFDKMKVIAARNLVKTSLDNYIDLVYERLKLFNRNNINKGIDLGISKVNKKK